METSLCPPTLYLGIYWNIILQLNIYPCHFVLVTTLEAVTKFKAVFAQIIYIL